MRSGARAYGLVRRVVPFMAAAGWIDADTGNQIQLIWWTR